MTDSLYEVPDWLLRQFHLGGGPPSGDAYRCSAPQTVLLPLTAVKPPVLGPGRRGLDQDRLTAILQAIAAGTDLPPVPVYREPGANVAVLLDGAHRYFASAAVGYRAIPCQQLSRDEEGKAPSLCAAFRKLVKHPVATDAVDERHAGPEVQADKYRSVPPLPTCRPR